MYTELSNKALLKKLLQQSNIITIKDRLNDEDFKELKGLTLEVLARMNK
jgi:enolase